MKKLSILTLLLTFLFAAGASARYHRGHDMHQWWNNDEMVKSVGLTDEQLTEIKKIDESYNDKFSKLHEDMKKMHMEMKDLMNNPKSSDKDITAKHNEMMIKKNELMSLQLEKELKIRGVLKPEQITKLGEARKQQMMEWKKGMDCPNKEGKECPYKDTDGE